MNLDANDVKVGAILASSVNSQEPGRLFLVLEVSETSKWGETDWLVEAKVWSLFDQKIMSCYIGPKYWALTHKTPLTRKTFEPL